MGRIMCRAADQFLMLAILMYRMVCPAPRYTAWWVSVSNLYQSTATSVDSGTGATRGLVIVWSRARYGDSPPLFSTPQLPAGYDNGQPWVPLKMVPGGVGAGSSSDSHSGVSGYAVAWIVVGCLLVGGAVGGLAVFVMARARQGLVRVGSVEEGVSGSGARLLTSSSSRSSGLMGRTSTELGHPGLWPPIGKMTTATGYGNPQPSQGLFGFGGERPQKLRTSDVEEGQV